MESSDLKFRKNISQLGEVLKLMLPKNKQETFIFLGFVVFYFSYSIILTLNTSIIDNQDYIYDVYFSMDNPIIYNEGYVYMEGHPLMMYFTYPFILLGNCLGTLLGYKAKTVFLVLICITLISMSVIYVHRYLKEIVGLKGFILPLLIIFYGFFSTNLTLCFTPESFTITAFLLSFMVYYYSYCMQIDKGVRLLTNAFFAIGLGGVTITNFAKGIIPMLFAKESRKVIIRKIIIISVVFGLLVLWMQLQYDFIGLIKMRLTGNISQPSKGVYYEKVIDMFFAAPMLFPTVMMDMVKSDNIMINAISIDYFRHWWQYCFAFVMFVVLVFAVAKNYKNRYVQILILMLAVDVVIHVLIRYGLRDPFIYGGHWVFMVPIFIGWLYTALKNKKSRKYLTILISVLLLVILVNNIYNLVEFINLALEHYPPHADIKLM